VVIRRQLLCNLVNDLYTHLPDVDTATSSETLDRLTDLELVRLAYRIADVVSVVSKDDVIIDWRALRVI
jgi:hypothetical protein